MGKYAQYTSYIYIWTIHKEFFEFLVFMKGLKKIISELLLGGAISLSGCFGGYLPFTSFNRKGVYPEVGGRATLVTALKYDVSLGRNIQTTPVHPNDISGGSGSATTDVSSYCTYTGGRDNNPNPSSISFLLMLNSKGGIISITCFKLWSKFIRFSSFNIFLRFPSWFIIPISKTL